MNLIWRPPMPPASLTISKYAAWHRAIVPSSDTGPLRAAVLPILSSVAVTPGTSSDREGREASNSDAAAADPSKRERRSSKGMDILPVDDWLRFAFCAKSWTRRGHGLCVGGWPEGPLGHPLLFPCRVS